MLLRGTCLPLGRTGGSVASGRWRVLSGSSGDDYNLLGSPAATGIGGNIVHLIITLAIAGSIFGYYWYDEHRGN